MASATARGALEGTAARTLLHLGMLAECTGRVTSSGWGPRRPAPAPPAPTTPVSARRRGLLQPASVPSRHHPIALPWRNHTGKDPKRALDAYLSRRGLSNAESWTMRQISSASRGVEPAEVRCCLLARVRPARRRRRERGASVAIRAPDARGVWASSCCPRASSTARSSVT